MKQHHGIALPLFSLRNPKGSAVGEFYDLLPMIQWCKKIGFDIIQLLPLNDSGSDASPYSALSAMALHPIYISLGVLPFVTLVPDYKEWLQALSTCNSSQRFHYPTVLENKKKFLKSYYEVAFEKIAALDAYKQFVAKEGWLDDYAQYLYLKQMNDEKPWWEWTSDELHDEKELNFHKMMQFIAFSQLNHVKQTAEASGIMLKGDIPILINRDSADVWAHQSLFLLQYAAGSPPDMYAKEGQYWGFPIYNWPHHDAHDFAWWKERLRVAEQFYHLYRIDHIVGFFRIFAIPVGKPATEGFFLPHDEREWLPQGEKIMRILLASTSMKPIGEDLGTVPPPVRTCLRNLGIPGTKVYRWERRWNEDSSFIPVSEYIPESMTTVSTHDSEPLAEWWKNDGEEVEAFCRFKGWEYAPELSYEKRLEILSDSHHSGSQFHINLLQEYLNLFPELSWDHPEDERINIPGSVQDTNWTYRFRPTIDQIVSHKKLATVMRQLRKPRT